MHITKVNLMWTKPVRKNSSKKTTENPLEEEEKPPMFLAERHKSGFFDPFARLYCNAAPVRSTALHPNQPEAARRSTGWAHCVFAGIHFESGEHDVVIQVVSIERPKIIEIYYILIENLGSH